MGEEKYTRALSFLCPPFLLPRDSPSPLSTPSGTLTHHSHTTPLPPPQVVVGKATARATPLLDVLDAASLPYVTYNVTSEPTTDMAKEAVGVATLAACDGVIGFGGGSVLDMGKAVAALIANGGEPLDYLEVIGAGKKLTKPSVPYVAIPTTAGTGAEVTKNAVLASPEHRVKVSLRSEFMLPTLAVVDPDLTVSCPPAVTMSCGLDAFTQCLEPFVSHLANPVTDGFCREGLKRASRSLQRAVTDGADIDAREDMAMASLCGGLALANAKLGAVHGFAGPVGGMFPTAPHGAVCAALLAAVIRVNIVALTARMPDGVYLDRFREAAVIMTGRADASAEDGAKWVDDLCAAIRVPGLSAYGVKEEHFPAIVAKSAKSSSMKGNPIELTAEELTAILKASL